MNPTFKEYVFDFAELKLLGAVCLKCQTETIIDVTNTSMHEPQRCASCGIKFSDRFVTSLRSFCKIYENFTDKDADATVRIRVRREVNVADL
jgi:transposase-like protein